MDNLSVVIRVKEKFLSKRICERKEIAFSSLNLHCNGLHSSHFKDKNLNCWKDPIAPVTLWGFLLLYPGELKGCWAWISHHPQVYRSAPCGTFSFTTPSPAIFRSLTAKELWASYLNTQSLFLIFPRNISKMNIFKGTSNISPIFLTINGTFSSLFIHIPIPGVLEQTFSNKLFVL